MSPCFGADNTAIVEPLTNDVDPMGGVLSVTTVSAPADSGIKVWSRQP